MPQMNNIIELHGYLDYFLGDLAQQGSAQLNTLARDWFLSKKRSYSTEEYLKQIERNAIYFAEATFMSCFTISQYIHKGEPLLQNPSQIQEYMDHWSRAVVLREIVPPILAYIQGTSSQVPNQISDITWSELRQQNLTGRVQDYRAHLAKVARVYYVGTTLIDMFQKDFVLANSALAGAGSRFAFHEVVAAVRGRTVAWTHQAVGLYQVNGRPASDEFVGMRYDIDRFLAQQRG